jgi:hypothetical protein
MASVRSLSQSRTAEAEQTSGQSWLSTQDMLRLFGVNANISMLWEMHEELKKGAEHYSKLPLCPGPMLCLHNSQANEEAAQERRFIGEGGPPVRQLSSSLADTQ